LLPEAKIIVGGPAVNTCANLKDLATFFPAGTALVKGDGEKALPILVSALIGQTVDQAAIMELRGTYVKAGNFEHWDERPNILSVEELNAQPALVGYPELVAEIKMVGALRLNTRRGCRYRCVFCSHKYHLQPIAWTAERIVQELKRIDLMVKKGILPPAAREVTFDDDDFFQDRARAVSFLRAVAADPALSHSFRFDFQGGVGSFFRRGKLDKQLLDLLAAVKPLSVKIGTDGFHPAVLKYLGKGGYTFEMAEKLMQALDRRGIKQVHYSILTFPDITLDILIDQLENIKRTMRQFKTMSLSVNVNLSAFENSRLAALIDPRNCHKVVSPAGAVKQLPVNLPIVDARLNKLLNEILGSSYFSVRDLKRFMRVCGKGHNLGIAKLLKARRRLPEKLSIYEAISRFYPSIIYMTALGLFLDGLKAARDQNR
jgi:hypothetical protein